MDVIENNLLEVVPIPAFQDNYIWLIKRGKYAALVDPGDAEPALKYLQAQGLTLDAILITHHHSDHVGGVSKLLQTYPASVYAPHLEHHNLPHIKVAEGNIIRLSKLGLELQVLETPGHTLGHVTYYGANCLFCGDTLFGCGCGRIFDGTCNQLFSSLLRLSQLPSETQIYCAHEYTLQNIRFARMLDSENLSLRQREVEVIKLREQASPTLPSSISLEIATNPFLRCGDRDIQQAVARLSNKRIQDEEAVFCAMRELKNHY